MRSEPLGIEQLSKLPYLRTVPRDGRIVPLITFYEPAAADWHLHMIVKPGELGRMAGGEPISGSYLSPKVAAPSTDVEFALGTLVIQHLSFIEALDLLDRLQNDVHRCAAILEKYHLLWETRLARDRSASLLVQSELEYLLFLLRSLYDLLQGMVRTLAAKFIHLTGSNEPKIKGLPSSFREMVMTNDRLRSVDEIEDRWNLPRALAAWYVEEGQFFRLLRSLRDGIAHRGATVPTVFETEWGFAVSPDKDPWKQVHSLLPGERQPNDLASLRGLFAEFIHRGIGATDGLTVVLHSLVQLPEPIFQDVRLFIRSPFGNRLAVLDDVRRQPWEGRDQIAPRVVQECGMSEQLEVFATGAISSEDVDACVSLLDEGGALTDVRTAADELPHCLFVVVMRDAAGLVIGVAAVKDQRPQYAAGIASERKSGYQFDALMHEFGYVVVKESHQGKGYSARITEKLLSLLPGKPLFATTSNPRMLATLQKYGFTQKGKTWKSPKGKDLSLWIKD